MDSPVQTLPGTPAAPPAVTPAVTPFLDTEGTVRDVSASDLHEADSAGWKQLDEATADHMVAMKEAATHPIAAGTLGAIHGLLPFGPAIVEGLGGPTEERQGMLEQGNPVPYGVGKFVGSIGQFAGLSAVTGGIGGLAEGAEALSGAGDVVKAAETAPEVTQPFIKQVISHITPGQVVKTAMETGTNNVADTINERELGNPEANGETLASAFGHGAFFGAVTHPLFALGAVALPSAVRGLGNSISKLTDTAQTALEKVVPKLRPDLLAIAEGDQHAVQTGLRNIYDSNQPGAVGSRDIQVGRAAQKVADALNEADDQLDDTKKVLLGDGPGSYNQALKNSLHDSEFTKAQPKLFKWATDALTALEANPDIDTKLVQNKLGAYINYLGNKETGDMFELHEKSRNLRQFLDKTSDWASPVATPTINLVNREVTRGARANMIDPAIWGKDAAELTAKFNAGHEFLNSQKDFYQKLGNTTFLTERPIDEGIVNPQAELPFPGQKQLELQLGDRRTIPSLPTEPHADPSMQRNFATRPTKEANGIAIKNLFKRLATGDDTQLEGEVNQLFNARISGLQKYADMAKEVSEIGGAKYETTSFADNLKNIAASKKAGVIQAALAKPAQSSGLLSEVAAGVGGKIVGGAIGLPGLGAALGTGKAAYDALRGKPALTAEILGTIHKLASKQTKVISTGIESFLGKNAGKFTQLAANAKNIHEDNGFKVGEDKSLASKSGVIQRSAEVNNILNNPTALQKILTDNTSRLTDSGLPVHAQAVQSAAMARLNALKAILPPPSSALLPQDRVDEINPERKAMIDRVYPVIQDPSAAIINAMHSGMLTQDMIDAAKASNPRTFSRIQTELQQQIMDMPRDQHLTYNQKQMVSLVLGSPISPDVSPEQLAFQQQIWNPPQQPNITPPPQSTPKKNKPRATGLDKLSVAESSQFGPPGYGKNKE